MLTRQPVTCDTAIDTVTLINFLNQVPILPTLMCRTWKKNKIFFVGVCIHRIGRIRYAKKVKINRLKIDLWHLNVCECAVKIGFVFIGIVCMCVCVRVCKILRNLLSELEQKVVEWSSASVAWDRSWPARLSSRSNGIQCGISKVRSIVTNEGLPKKIEIFDLRMSFDWFSSVRFCAAHFSFHLSVIEFTVFKIDVLCVGDFYSLTLDLHYYSKTSHYTRTIFVYTQIVHKSIGMRACVSAIVICSVTSDA